MSSQSDGNMAEETAHIETATPQTLHYTLANQQVQFHRIGEDGQVQVVSVMYKNSTESNNWFKLFEVQHKCYTADEHTNFPVLSSVVMCW